MKKMIIGLTIGMLIGSSTVAMAATSSTVKATLVKYRIMINGQNKVVSANQLSYNGNTYIQLREAGTLFGYNATYVGSTKTIHFDTKDTVKEKWITLGEFAGSANLKVELNSNKKDVYNVIRGKDQVILSLDTQNLGEGEERGSATTNGTIIYFTKINGSLVLSKASLKTAGLM
ncbi:hypothetical protein J23TS9_38220 [Paenibacillus sp. J23TS9]|uniref:stalk domain-containing protein n=1 Tax=Paenibacillus sp. J23TS9 TaxID=2807193 RepID=UPI001B14F87E|nr:stalk domain-containing protein [Paenibacillus sp. J23TS9]GIP28692.1 hypothetical protein J23TS9_38220 [Paenibacillus sp. J23TS9]